jgi:hypothetical protein
MAKRLDGGEISYGNNRCVGKYRWKVQLNDREV